MTMLYQNAHDLEQELRWFASLLDTRFKLYFGQAAAYEDVFEIAPPDISASTSAYANLILEYELTFAERVTLILATVSYIRPQLLDIFYTKNELFDRKFTEFGGIWNGPDGDFIPTGETLAFILGGNNLEIRFAVRQLLSADHVFTQHNILEIKSLDGLPIIKSPLRLSNETLSCITTGEAYRPVMGIDFPAQYIQTQLTWDDLVLHPGTRTQIDDINIWLQHNDTLMLEWGMAAKLRPGHRSLFYGSPGTGKTMTACLLGKSTGCDVYKVDLSLVVSKYIGETEKNLAKLFDQAQHKSWILFFDEADALFGKRTTTKDAHDRYANQEVSFLLQRIETFDSLAILSSNQKDNLDEAFTRRFESIIYFPIPRPEERLKLWQQGFSERAQFDKKVNLVDIAEKHKLTGGTIMNVIRYVSLQAIHRGNNMITMADIEKGIRREYAKEGNRV